MKRKNTTRNALFTSILALLLCVSMLVGTTFAWFTDSVASGNNVIAAGNLDVELEYWDGAKYVPVTVETNVFKENTLWEPGHTEVVHLRVRNAGTLALKYNLGIHVQSEEGAINAKNEVFKLSDYIRMGVIETSDIYTDRAAARDAVTSSAPLSTNYAKNGFLYANTSGKTSEEYVALVVYMPETIGNEANYKTGTTAPKINLGLELFATQLEAESDSFGPDYDKDAVWTGAADTTWYNDTDTEFTLTSAEDLAGLAELVNAGNNFANKTVKLGANIDLNEVNWTPIGQGANKFVGTFIGTGYTISNLRVVGEKALGLFGRTFSGAHIEGVTIDGAYVSGNDYVGAILGQGYLGHNCIVNCTVNNATIIATPYFDTEKGVYDGGAKAGVIAGQAYNGNITGCTVTNSSVTAYRDLGGIAGMLDFDGGNVTVEASGNTVKKVSLNYIGAAGAYEGNKPNQNMGEIVGRVGDKAKVGTNTTNEVTMNEAAKGVIQIVTLDQLIDFAEEVNSGKTYAGATVQLGADIDLMNMEWTPIGNSTNKFQGTFDGNGHTIFNLKITGNNSYVGLFGYTTNGAVKNLTVKNATVSGYVGVGVVAGSPYTSTYSDITVTGHVEVNGLSYVGGVGGRNAYATWNNITVDADETSYVKANSVENGTAYRTYVGGVIGFMGEGTHKVTNVTSNIDAIGTTCDVGGIVGIAHEGNSFENITCTGDVTLTNAAEAGYAEEIGGIAGVWMNKGRNVTFTNCKFTGTLSANITEGVDLSDNTITGAGYYADDQNLLIIDGKTQDSVWVATDAASLENALAQGGEVVLTAGITLPEAIEIPEGVAVSLNLNSMKITGSNAKDAGALIVNNGNLSIVDGEMINTAVNGGAVIDNKGTLTLENVEIVGAPIDTTGYPSYAIYTSGKLTVEEGTSVTSDRGAISLSDGADVTINDGSFAVTDALGTRVLTSHVIYAEGYNSKLTIKDGTFAQNYQAAGNTGASVICPAGATINIYGGTFSYAGTVGQSAVFQNYMGYGAPVNVYGGTFNDKSVEKNVADGYEVTEENGIWTVSATKVSSSSDLSSAISAGKAVELTEDITYSTGINKDATINLAGNTFEATNTISLTNNADLTMSGGDYVVNSTYGHIDVRPSSAEGSVVTFENVDFSFNKLGPTYGPSTNRLGSVVEVCATVTDAKSVVVFKNCTFNNAQVVIEGMSGKTGIVDITFENCTFNALTSSAPIYVQNYLKGTITVKKCTFNLECTSSSASAISVSPSTDTVVTVIAENNTINAVAATPTDSSVTGVDVVKVNGTPSNIKFISAYANTTVTESGTVKTGIVAQ